MAFFGVFLKTIYLEVFDGSMFFHRFGASDSDVIYGYIYVTLFILFICVGYVLSAQRLQRAETGEVARTAVELIYNRHLLAAFALLVSSLVVGSMLAVRELGGLSSAFSLATIDTLNSSKIVRIEGVEGYGASFAAVRIFLFIPTLAFTVFLARYTISHKRADLVFTLLFITVEFFLTVLEGKRFGLVLILGNAAIVSVLLGRRLSPSALVKAIFAIVLIFALFVMMSTFRASRTATEDVRYDPWPAIEQILGSTYFLDINVPILIIKLTEPEDRFWGESYTYWTFAWIPRQIWPEKPAITLGPYVKQEVLGITGSFGGVNPTGPGEAYLNFGWPGVLVGLGLGFFFRRIEEFTLSSRGILQRGGLWVYPIVIFPLMLGTMQSSFSGALVSAAVVYILMRFVLFGLSRRIRIFPRRSYSPRKSDRVSE
jgi:oligosaccharide repeat unit polymerase